MAKFDGSNDRTGPTTPLENECVAKEILSVSGMVMAACGGLMKVKRTYREIAPTFLSPLRLKTCAFAAKEMRAFVSRGEGAASPRSTGPRVLLRAPTAAHHGHHALPVPGQSLASPTWCTSRFVVV
jgi:hypothetical protein